MAVAELYKMTPLEIAYGTVVGYFPQESGGMRPPESASPRTVLEQVLLAAMSKRPCVVAFSGGRDSSALLAVATAVARREGLPDPLPVTRRYPGVPGANEDEWQEQVIRHLDLNEWVKLELDDEVLDLIGPIAAPRLRRYGVLWPPLLHTDVPILEVARGGVIVNGEGGDQVLVAGYHRMSRIRGHLRGRSMLHPRSVAKAGLLASPAPIRRRFGTRLLDGSVVTWLRPEAHMALIRAVAAGEASQPLRWDLSVQHAVRHRGLVLALRNRAVIAQQHGVTYVHPFTRLEFVAALATAGGWTGRRSRAEWMTELVGDLLPEPVLRRQTKAFFNRTVHGRHSREFAARWDGSGVNPAVVDVDALRAAWLSEEAPAMSAALLQAAWLAQGNPDADD